MNPNKMLLSVFVLAFVCPQWSAFYWFTYFCGGRIWWSSCVFSFLIVKQSRPQSSSVQLYMPSKMHLWQQTKHFRMFLVFPADVAVLPHSICLARLAVHCGRYGCVSELRDFVALWPLCLRSCRLSSLCGVGTAGSHSLLHSSSGDCLFGCMIFYI